MAGKNKAEISLDHACNKRITQKRMSLTSPSKLTIEFEFEKNIGSHSNVIISAEGLNVR